MLQYVRKEWDAEVHSSYEDMKYRPHTPMIESARRDSPHSAAVPEIQGPFVKCD